jgi:hypothetical protein
MPVTSICSHLGLCDGPALTNISVIKIKPEVFVYYLDISSYFILKLDIEFIYLLFKLCALHTYVFIFLFSY